MVLFVVAFVGGLVALLLVELFLFGWFCVAVCCCLLFIVGVVVACSN